MADYEEFDVTGGLEEGFENLDVTQEPQAEAAVSLAALGSLTEREEELRAVSQARDEFEQRFLIDPGQRAFDAAEESPAGLGNIVGVGIGEKEVNGIPIGQLAVKVFVKEKLGATQVASEALVPSSVGGSQRMSTSPVKFTPRCSRHVIVRRLGGYLLVVVTSCMLGTGVSRPTCESTLYPE